MKLIKALVASVVLTLLVAPSMVQACSLVPHCNVGYQHSHNAQPQVTVVQQVTVVRPPPNVIEQLVYVADGASRIAGSVYSIRGMEQTYQFSRMYNDRYRRGLDTRVNTEYGVQSYDRYNYGGRGRGRGHHRQYRPRTRSDKW